MFAVPVAFLVLLFVGLAEDADRRAVLIDDEAAQAAAAIGRQGLAEEAAKLGADGGHCCKYLARESICAASSPSACTRMAPSLRACTMRGCGRVASSWREGMLPCGWSWHIAQRCW